MRTLSPIIILAIFCTACSTPSDRPSGDIVDRTFESIYFVPQSHSYHYHANDQPVSETLTTHFSDGSVKGEITFAGGLISHGNLYHTNGLVWYQYSASGDTLRFANFLEDGTKVFEVARDITTNRFIETRSWYTNGSPRHELTPTIIRGWYSNGVLQEVAHFKNGKLDGQVAKWHKNGQKAGETFYRENQRHGTWKEWDEHGNLISDRHYDMGERLSDAASG